VCTECTPYVSASSREWRSGATPTTECEAHWPLDFRVFIQKIERIFLWKDLQFVLKYKWYKECASYMSTSSREWRGGATPTTDCEAHWTLDFRVFIQKIGRMLLWENLQSILKYKWCTECTPDTNTFSLECRTVWIATGDYGCVLGCIFYIRYWRLNGLLWKNSQRHLIDTFSFINIS
jgi:hypothetical protein